MSSPQPTRLTRIGVYFGVVQFFFATSWTVYVIFLPKLAAQVGIPKENVIFLLMFDQLVAMVVDIAMGLMADRVASVFGKLGKLVVWLTLFSCAAFLLLPFAPLGGQSARTAFLGLTLVWIATASALKAPPMKILGKYAPKSAIPWLTSLTLFGMGIAGAVAPYLTVALRDADPRLPFALSSLALLVTTYSVLWAERHLHKTGSPEKNAQPQGKSPPLHILLFLVGVALLTLGFQIHFAINSSHHYLRFANTETLDYLIPIFWIGFNLFVLPVSGAIKRYGHLPMMAIGGILSGLVALATVQAGNLTELIAAQFLTGASWGCVLLSAMASAIELGRTGREGKVVGALYSLSAAAIFARMAIMATGLHKEAHYAGWLEQLPTLAWLGAGALLTYIAFAHRETARGTLRH